MLVTLDLGYIQISSLLLVINISFSNRTELLLDVAVEANQTINSSI